MSDLPKTQAESPFGHPVSGARRVLCAVDDLLFKSKLRGAATHAAVDLQFVRSPDDLVGRAREASPALVILDLNADRLQPLDMARAMRSDPQLAGVPLVGFVSHVQTDRIAAARDAGVEQVLARSAFVVQLPALPRGDA